MTLVFYGTFRAVCCTLHHLNCYQVNSEEGNPSDKDPLVHSAFILATWLGGFTLVYTLGVVQNAYKENKTKL